ncbi:MAG: DHH family phosphoesterase [Lachnospiraceae bacterium]|nr:DHH family phosphoesterase [Lachnospiraceae bacterium]
MNVIEYRSQLKHYLRAPIYLVIIMLAMDIGLFFYDLVVAFTFLGLVIIYLLVLSIFYGMFRKKLSSELLQFAAGYAESQNELMDNFEVPYVLLDRSGRIVWHNKKFFDLCGEVGNFHDGISKIFPQITIETIREIDGLANVEVEFGDRIFDATLQSLDLKKPKTNGLFSLEGNETSLVALTMFDITELNIVKDENRNIKMVQAVIYIDNYEETVEKVDIVKRALLLAVIDRKVSQYFQSVDGIVQKIEKDKYFVVFQHKYLKKLIDTRFAILEDVKSIKVGNENEVTLSIGVGDSKESYRQTLEYSNAAINIALGRGGSQAVVKSEGEVSYYGVHGKQVEKNTRVKARVKAKALREMMEARGNVLVMGHQISDIDAFGAAVGVCVAAKMLGKKCQIVLNTITSSLRPVVDNLLSMDGVDPDLIINSEEAVKCVNPDTLVMVVDTNRATYTECPKLLEICNTIVVFDHHRQGEGIIENPVLSYIEPYASSTCEMIAEVLQYFDESINIRPQEADALYAGILIDTNNFVTKTGVRTFEAAAYLRRNGADMTRVRKLLRESMEAYKARAEVVRKAEVYRNIIAISSFLSEQVESPTIIGAQAANELLDIVGIRASFVLTDYNGKIYVSARSIDDIDVQIIMEKIGGGGHINVAGAQLSDSTIESATERIEAIIDDMIEKGEIIE